MTKSEKWTLAASRLQRLKNRPQNIKCPGVVRKLTRQVRNLEK